jgi:hypothetical protein
LFHKSRKPEVRSQKPEFRIEELAPILDSGSWLPASGSIKV